MNRKNSTILTFFLVCVLCFMGTANVTAAPKGQQENMPVADVMFGPGGITWMPTVNYARLVLNVARPDGTVFSKTFTAGSAPFIDLSGIYGEKPVDGRYSYELQAVSQHGPRVRKNPETAGMVKERGPSYRPLVQTGYFLVREGMIVTSGTAEPGLNKSGDNLSRAMDEVIYDDLIVDGSLCVGNDCYSGLAFGFDTIVLMENNLRIYFDDTSNTSSFPNNDWRIICNDTTDGGGAYFALQDVSGGLTPFTIEAGAKTNSLYVDDDGQVGIGTSGPVFELHIKEGDTPSVRLHQSTAYGWPEQIWDVGGNETSFFVRDGTHAARLPFRIEPETPTSTLCLKSNGYVGVGTWSPDAQLHVEYAGPTKLILENTSADKWTINSAANGLRINANDSSTILFTLTDTGDLTIEGDITSSSGSCCVPDYVFNSDYPLMSMTELAEFIKKENHLPNIPAAEEMKKKGVNMTRFQMKLLEKVEELTLYTLSQEETIETQKKAIDAQKQAINELKARLAALEEKLQDQ